MPFVVYIKCTQYLTHLHRVLKKKIGTAVQIPKIGVVSGGPLRSYETYVDLQVEDPERREFH